VDVVDYEGGASSDWAQGAGSGLQQSRAADSKQGNAMEPADTLLILTL
jgi:hypothetical protein